MPSIGDHEQFRCKRCGVKKVHFLVRAPIPDWFIISWKCQECGALTEVDRQPRSDRRKQPTETFHEPKLSQRKLDEVFDLQSVIAKSPTAG